MINSLYYLLESIFQVNRKTKFITWFEMRHLRRDQLFEIRNLKYEK